MRRHEPKPTTVRRRRRPGRSVAIALALVAATLGAAGCSSTDGPRSDGRGNRDDGTTRIPGGDVTTAIDDLPRSDLSDAEVAGLVKMREEELLARDAYLELGDQWDTNVFANISDAEQTHTDAVGALLDRYDIDDPATDHVRGTFTDPELQTLYDSLVEQGRGSLVDALTVGATIEDLDLADLAALETDAPDVAWVYSNLARGSRNHLRAFVRQLDRNGADYTPTHISRAELDEIVDGDMERGSGG